MAAEKVAKIVQCGEPDRTKVAGDNTGGLFVLPSSVGNGQEVNGLHWAPRSAAIA